MLGGEQSASAVDALALAKLQIEALYSFCFLLQDGKHMQLFLKSAWKTKYPGFIDEGGT